METSDLVLWKKLPFDWVLLHLVMRLVLPSKTENQILVKDIDKPHDRKWAVQIIRGMMKSRNQGYSSALLWIAHTAMNSSGSVKILRLLRAMPVKHELSCSSLVELSNLQVPKNQRSNQKRLRLQPRQTNNRAALETAAEGRPLQGLTNSEHGVPGCYICHNIV